MAEQFTGRSLQEPAPQAWDREGWLRVRRSGIGGSDAAAVIGVSRWKTPLDVYLEKVSDTPELEASPAMHWGSRLESVVREEYGLVTDRKVYVPSVVVRHAEIPYLIGTLDGYTDDGRVLEVKTTRSAEGWGDPGTDEVPEHYLAQVQHYLLVTGFEVADIAVLIAGSDFRIYTVPADADLQRLLLEAERRFWIEHVLAAIPPDPVTYHDAMTRWPQSKGIRLQASQEMIDLACQLKEIRAQAKVLEESEEKLRGEICAFLGEADTLVAGTDVLATWKSQAPAIRLDTAAFKAQHPDLYAQFAKPGAAVRRFLLK